MPKAKKPKILVMNGPNLNMLGTREPHLYGSDTLEAINSQIRALAVELGLGVEFFQSNSQGALVDKIQQAHGAFAGIVINPAAYTHTSVAIRDALAFFGGPVVEVHLSNIHRREDFRSISYVSGIAAGVVAGLGKHGYFAALRFLAATLSQNKA
ncbi:MAG: type II 3-dehydroquinate dehydratase [Desulfatibacillaceae bacterium]|nr:type II 3-dehydroquinate dehydratase [Desulfatibacillaceae bacterium]